VVLRHGEGRGRHRLPAQNLERVFDYKAGKPLSRTVLDDGKKAIDSAYRSRATSMPS